MPAAMTYTSLLDDIETYAERHDQDFLDQLPRFVMLAENRLAEEARGLGFLKPVTGNFTQGSATLQKPDRWRETLSFNYGTGTNNNTRNFLKLRSYEYCRSYWPDPTATGAPKYYADWDYSHWLLVGTPDVAYPFELLYYERPQPLDTTNETNWTTEYAPQLLLYACLLEAQPFLKNDARIQVFQQQYDRCLMQISADRATRVVDRAAVVKEAAK